MKKNLKIYIPLTVIVLLVIVASYLWYRNYAKYITTDDAHVDADNLGVQSKIPGRLISLFAEEGDTVHEGMLVAVLDSSDVIVQRNQAIAQKQQALAGMQQARARYSSDEKSIRVLEIALERASEDLNRAKNQAEGGVITAEQFDHAGKAYETASAQLDAARAQLQVSKAAIITAEASIQTADAQINIFENQLKNTRLYSPSDGVVAKRWLLPGDVVQPGQSVLTISRNSNIWIIAFPEETNISEIFAGQEADFTVDAFPDVEFSGKVYMVGASTASVFSLIPANNASGNFTKVTQRVPVRISIDNASGNRSVSSYNFLPGMSATVKIIREKE
ncbi:MAG TPA: HlyD family secretion protein [Bacteroidales bacterium]|nr:HlyD family secretion protein [Bacteroidales bacterium]